MASTPTQRRRVPLQSERWAHVFTRAQDDVQAIGRKDGGPRGSAGWVRASVGALWGTGTGARETGGGAMGGVAGSMTTCDCAAKRHAEQALLSAA